MTHRALALFTFVIFLFTGCGGDNSTGPKPEPEPNPPEAIINDDAYVVDPDVLSLSERTDDKLSFSFTGQASDIETGDVVVGEEDGGFLRRVTEVSTQNNTVTLNTTQASLTDVVEKGNFHQTIVLNFVGIEIGSYKIYRILNILSFGAITAFFVVLYIKQK